MSEDVVVILVAVLVVILVVRKATPTRDRCGHDLEGGSMCVHCWHDAGSPAIVNERTKEAAEAIRAVYDTPGCDAGGNLHAQIDDMNLEDEDFERLEEYGAPIQPSERRCFDLLKALTREERYSAMAIHEGWVKA